MTGISNLNILVQQGGNIQGLQQIKQQSSEYTQPVAAQNLMERAAEEKDQVQDTDESEKSQLKEDSSKEKRDGRSSKEKKGKKEEEEKMLASTGKILDTVV